MFGTDELTCNEFYYTLGYDEDGYQGTEAGINTVKVNAENGNLLIETVEESYKKRFDE